ncbi:MAG: cob(I)yrinic acid a,c-diamide adenosyltransferase [Clostridia bacterium]
MAVQIYTGDGKGKTTAALGLALRAVGAGMRVYFGQFCKYGEYSEIQCLRARFPEVTVAQFGSGGFIHGVPSEKEKQCAAAGFAQACAAVQSGQYDLIVLDELMMAVHLELVAEDAVLELIRTCPQQAELVMTGRYARPALREAADLVSEVKCCKHYYDAGLAARTGMER